MTRTLAALLIASAAFGADITVCSSGCDQTSVQAAMDAASSGDTITITAGEVFTTNNYIAGKSNIWIRTSNWRNLPPPGVRMADADRANMPRLTPTDMNDYTLHFGYAPIYIAQNGVNTSTDVITWSGALNSRLELVDNMEVMCGAAVDGYGGIMPSPLNTTTKYFVKGWNLGARTSQLSLTPGGTAIDITDVGSAASSTLYARPACAPSAKPTIGIWVTGIWAYDGGAATPLVRVGEKALPTHKLGPQVIFDRCFLEGTDGVISARRYDRPLHGIFINDGTGSEIRDSVIRTIFGQDESKCIGIDNASGVRIINNYCSATGIGLLIGGGDNLAQINNRDVVITGNFFDKPGETHWLSGHGAPSGNCYYGGAKPSGAFYLDVDVTQACASNACYVCGSDGQWAVQTGATIRTSTRQLKNHLEIKDLIGGLIEGNVFQGQNQDFAGQGWTYGISVIATDSVGLGGAGGIWTRGNGITFRNNYAYRNWTGGYIRNSKYSVANFSDVPMRNNGFLNNLFVGLGDMTLCKVTDSNSCSPLNGSNPPEAWFISSNQSGLVLSHNTHRGAIVKGTEFNNSASYTPAVLQMVSKDNLAQIQLIASFYTNDTIAPLRVDGGANDCTASPWTAFNPQVLFNADVYYTAANFWPLNLAHASCASSIANNPIRSNTDPLFVGTPSLATPNSALQATSVYSDQYADATHLASDGSSMGINEKKLTQWTVPAVNGTRNMREQLSLRAVRSGTTLQFNFDNRRNGAGVGASCTVSIYDSPSRAVSHRLATTTDTDGAFTFTGITTNPAEYVVDCDSTLGLHWDGEI